ncbi:GDYXXLXY domain-containing protein [Methylobacterium sp. A54F]
MRRYLLPVAFVALLAVQVLPSATLAWQQTQRLQQGRPVRLAVETRDPRDLFRGEYSVLAYEIGRPQGIAAATIPAGCDLVSRESCRLDGGRQVFVRLAADAEGIHRAVEVQFEPPAGRDLFVAGRLGSGALVRRGAPVNVRPGANVRASEPATCEHAACLSGAVTYGIEHWYGPQGVPAKLDRTARKDILVEARVANDGVAVLDGILIAGQSFARTARLW